MSVSTSNSQFKQDIFALHTAKNKTYIEIGGAAPIKINNTYLLENHGWKGFSLEFNKKCIPLWEIRKNKIYCDDAMNFNYVSALTENSLPMHIGYLSCDIEPPENTFAALTAVIEQGVTFDCITFEHDKYQSDIDYEPIVTEYLLSKGYKVAVKDVYFNGRHRVEGQKKKQITKCLIETWFVHSSIDFEPCSFNEFSNRFIGN